MAAQNCWPYSPTYSILTIFSQKWLKRGRKMSLKNSLCKHSFGQNVWLTVLEDILSLQSQTVQHKFTNKSFAKIFWAGKGKNFLSFDWVLYFKYCSETKSIHYKCRPGWELVRCLCTWFTTISLHSWHLSIYRRRSMRNRLNKVWEQVNKMCYYGAAYNNFYEIIKNIYKSIG